MELINRRVAVALLVATLASTRAEAHAQLRQANPAVGATIASAPSQVELTFSEALEPHFSTVVVQDAAGSQVDKRDLHVVGGDATHVAVGLPTVPAGSYTVIWHATSVDTHRTEGSFTFTIAP
jgi:methionine-rich copper-binding protein CopC